jgi:CheY-like chemotaxis protein
MIHWQREQRVMTSLNSAGCVLIVEDEAAFRNALAMAIGDEGYQVLCAGNGLEAISLLEHATPDVIILDIHMPVMNGPAFLAEYRRRHERQAPVIVCSTSRHDTLVEQLNVAASMNKPVDIDELLDAIGTYSTSSSAPDS